MSAVRCFAVFACLALSACLHAQPEVATGMTDSEPLYAGALQLYAAHRHRAANRVFDDFRVVRNPDSLFTHTHTLGVGANYSITRSVPGDWTFSAVIPVTHREFRTRVDDRVVRSRVSGLGDIAVSARARYLWWVPGDASQQGSSLSVALIAELPTGRSGQSTKGKRIPRSLQLGRGAVSLTAAHIGSYSNNRMELILTTLYSWRSVGVGGSNYDFGNVFKQEFEFKYRVIQEVFPGNTMFLMLGLAYEHTDYSRDNGVRVKDSGGQVFAVEPKIQWHPMPWWELKAVFSVPVWRNTHRTQLVDELSFRFSASWRFAT